MTITPTTFPLDFLTIIRVAVKKESIIGLISKGEDQLVVQLGKRYSDQEATGEKDEKDQPIYTPATCEMLVIKAPPGNDCTPYYNGRPMMVMQPKVLPSAD